MMMTSDILLALASFALVSSLTPGPNNLMLLASGTNFGFRRTVPHLLGVSLGFTLMVALVGGGLIEIFTAFPLAHRLLKIVSLVYLLYLAWKIATAPPPDGEQASTGKPFAFWQAMAFQWVNPKAWTMALTAISSYVPDTRSLAALAVVAGIFGAINLPSVCLWAMMGVQLRKLLHAPRLLRAFNVGAALLLVGSLYPVLFGGHD